MLESLRAALDHFGASLTQFLPRLLAALAVLVIGWLLATAFRGVTRRVLRWLRFDQLIERMGASEMLRKLFPSPPSATMGKTVYWLTWIAALLAALQALGISGIDALLADFVRFVPRLAAAVMVMVVGFLVSGLAWRASLLAAVSAGMHAAKLLGTLVRSLVIVATVAMALEQIDIGHGVMHTAFAIMFGAVMLAAALAFGLGGRDAARRFLEDRLLARDAARDQTEASHL
jgi:hypothetical protein